MYWAPPPRGSVEVFAPCRWRAAGRLRDPPDWVVMPPVAKVLPLVTARGLPGELDYLDPSGSAVGTVVRIPLGGRSVDGIVVGRAEGTDVPADK